MGRKKKKATKPWCWYCQREFEDEKILIQHQKAKHFKCHICRKKLYTGPGLAIHCVQVHKERIDRIPAALPGRDSVEVEVYGMEGIPDNQASGEPQAKASNSSTTAPASSNGVLPIRPAGTPTIMSLFPPMLPPAMPPVPPLMPGHPMMSVSFPPIPMLPPISAGASGPVLPSFLNVPPTPLASHFQAAIAGLKPPVEPLSQPSGSSKTAAMLAFPAYSGDGHCAIPANTADVERINEAKGFKNVGSRTKMMYADNGLSAEESYARLRGLLDERMVLLL
uniref:Zinc finger protein 207 n=1 Tax=Ascaris suum TaxID=6253 RepID=F1L2C5_ASCSU